MSEAYNLRNVLGIRISVEGVIDAYLRDSQARGLAPGSTIETYRSWLDGGPMRQWRADNGVTSLADLDTTAMLLWLRSRNISPHTIDGYRRTWRTFLLWAEENGHIDRAPKLKRRGVLPESERRNLTPDEERQILDAVVCSRDRVLVRFMISTGMRRGEVVAVNLDDLEDHGGAYVLKVSERVAKTRRYRRVPLDFPRYNVSNDLARYLAEDRPKTANRALWLTTRRGPSGDYERMTAQGVYQIFRRLTAKTGIHVFPHACRHTFGTRGLNAKIPKGSLMHAGGWRSERSLAHYTHEHTERMLRDWDDAGRH